MNALRFFLALSLIASSYLANAQVEVIHLRTKNYSATGFGAFLHFDIPVSEADYVTAEAGFGLFRKKDEHVGIAPMQASIPGFQSSKHKKGEWKTDASTDRRTPLQICTLLRYLPVLKEAYNLHQCPLSGPLLSVQAGYRQYHI